MKKRVLIADDNADICESIAMNIDDRYDVVMAHDGEQALQMVLAGGIDVMLLDVMMPVRDGASVLAAMQEHGCSVRVILSSASHNLESTARRLNAFDVLPKPFGIDDVEEKLARAVANG